MPLLNKKYIKSTETGNSERDLQINIILFYCISLILLDIDFILTDFIFI